MSADPTPVPRPELPAAAGAVAAVLDGIRDDQLGDPTPCPAYAVGDLVDHVLGLCLAFTAAARGTELGDPGEAGAAGPSGDATRLPDDWRSVGATRLQDLAAAWADPAAHEGTAVAGGVTMPAEVAALVALDELVVHGWDLAVATGQAYGDRPDLDGAVAACTGFAASFAAPGAEGGDEDGDAAGHEEGPGLFGPPVPVPDDAPALHRLLGLTGRDPGWAPPAR